MKFLKTCDKGIEKVFMTFCALSQIAIVCIIVVQVFARDVFFFDMKKAANFPVPLMTFGMWVGAILIQRDRGHITVPLVATFIKNKKVVKIINIIMDSLAFIAIEVFSYGGFVYVITKVLMKNRIDPSTGLPEWILMIIIPVGALLWGVYFLVYIIKDIKSLKEVNNE